MQFLHSVRLHCRRCCSLRRLNLHERLDDEFRRVETSVKRIIPQGGRCATYLELSDPKTQMAMMMNNALIRVQVYPALKGRVMT